MNDLARRHALPDGTAPKLEDEQINEALAELPGWQVKENRLVRDTKVQNFVEALSLLNRIGAVAEEENHHPDLCLHGWNHLRIELYTHTANGISENDLIMAAKFNELLPPISEG